jgi:hypothetical protein
VETCSATHERRGRNFRRLPLGREECDPDRLSIGLRTAPTQPTSSAAVAQPIAYHFEGTVGVDAGRLGTPVFGPMTLMRGTFD